MRDQRQTGSAAAANTSASSGSSGHGAPGKTTLSQAAFDATPAPASGFTGSATPSGARPSPATTGRSIAELWAPPRSTAMVGGFAPGVDPQHNQQMIGGRTFGEAIGDAGRVAGTALGNVVGGAAATLTGINITSTTTAAATWSPHGQFSWQVGFATTGTNGWLVQEVVNTYRAQDATGTDLGGVAPTPQYWEAWAVDAASAVTPSAGGTNDFWLRPGRGASTQGHWSMRGKVYFTTTDPATQGLTPGGVPDAGILLSSTAAPAGLGVARLHRYAQGTWDSTGAAPTHTGSAS